MVQLRTGVAGCRPSCLPTCKYFHLREMRSSSAHIHSFFFFLFFPLFPLFFLLFLLFLFFPFFSFFSFLFVKA